MNSILNTLGFRNINEYDNKITTTLSSYTEKIVNSDKTVTYRTIQTPYFLENDTWNINYFKGIQQFKDITSNCKIITFSTNNEKLKKEFKLVFYNKIFNEEWTFKTAIYTQNPALKLLVKFIEKYYPNISSILDLNINETNLKWVDWIENNNIKSTRNFKDKVSGENYIGKSLMGNYLNNMYDWIYSYTDLREEWDKDKWDVRNLSKYGIGFTKSMSNYYINFNSFKTVQFKISLKKYFKQRLLSNKGFSWNTAHSYITCLSKFFNFILEKEPTWTDLNKLERNHIEEYLEYLNIFNKSIVNKNSNPKSNIGKNLRIIQKFLSDIQVKNYNIAPFKNVKTLILADDKPSIFKKEYDKIDYIPEFVLEQLFNNINSLHKEVVPVVWIMYKTGLRISDALGLKQDCLIRLNNKFWIETDIEKTYVKGHKIPIDNELADMLAVLIDNAKKSSNQDNNPENYIFVRYTGNRKGLCYGQNWIRDKLNAFARNLNILDESGNRFHFKNHAFRHTYAIKMLNGGADILTVQELLAHASPEMTMRYARLLDDTKRKAFDNAVKQGVFSFDESAKLKEENNGEIPTDTLNMLWTNHKLNAIDTPYGTCLQRTNGKCSFAKQPPCLTCNGGKPCKDLCVGAFEGDILKYEILINSTKAMIEGAKVYNRTEMIKENKELLNLYENIYSKIIEGNIVYSRLDRLKRKGDTNVSFQS